MKAPIGQLDPAIRTVHIWGGGIAGLLMGHFLKARGFHVHLYEKSERLGGKLLSHVDPHGVIEEAANALYATPETEAWLRGLGLIPIPATPKLKRRLWRGKPRSPLSWQLLGVVPRLFKHSPRIDDHTTVADFFRPLLGQQVETLLTPALQGVYGCGAESLTVSSVWPQLRAARFLQVLKQLKGPRARSVSFQNGMSEWVQRLAEGLDVHLNHESDFILRPNTIVCTEAHSAGQLLARVWPSGAESLQSVDYISLSSATVLTETPANARATFGFLFPRGVGINALGVLFNREIFPRRAGVTFIMPGNHAVTERLHADLTRLKIPLAPVRVRSWEKALPCYNASRVKAVRSLHGDPARPAHLVLFGNYVAGISLRDMVTTAQNFSAAY
jgi:protoporphyrinogen oxidase